MTAEADPADPRIGTTVAGRYLVERLLGRGGMGSVYLAEHTGLGSRVAIKFLLGDSADPAALARFRREARTASQISHPHVVQLHDSGTDGDDYIVMEYLEGRNLSDVLRDGKLDATRAVAIAEQILRGLQAIHDADIVHRDIKPGNIVLVEVDGNPDFVKIMDFGISKSIAGGHTLTESRHIIGTPRYMAPEQLLGFAVDHRADLYAVGVLVFEMMSGTTPFEATLSAPVEEQMLDQPPALDDAPEHVAAAVSRALSRAPNARFSDAAAFRAALTGKSSTIEPRPAGAPVDRTEAATVRAKASSRSEPPPRSRTRRAFVLAAIGTLVVTGAMMIARRGSGESPPDAAFVAMADAQPDVARTPAPDAEIDAAVIDVPADAPVVVKKQRDESLSRSQKATGEYCRCIADSDDNFLCLTAGPPQCQCQLGQGPLCSIPFQMAYCSNESATTFTLPGPPGVSCVGYMMNDSSPQTGITACQVCRDPSRRDFRGHERDSCAGYNNKGKRMPGQLNGCRGTPQ